IRGIHSLGTQSPGLARVLARPDAAGRDAQQQAPGIARIDADGMDPGIVISAARPLLALGTIPERANETPGSARVVGAEEPAGDGAAPQAAGRGRVGGLEGPDEIEAPRAGRAAHDVDIDFARRLLRPARGGHFL